MSIINATIIVQAVHFFIAYLFIKYLFFKPVFAQINGEDTLQESLITMVQDQQILVAQRERELAQHWQAVRSYFAQHTPPLKIEPIFAEQRPAIHIPQIDRSEIAQSSGYLAKELLKTVSHVHD